MRDETWKILLVDPSAQRREELRRMLLSGLDRHCHFFQAESGAAALRACLATDGGAFDCLLLDYRVPDMDAGELLAALRNGSISPPLPVVVLTGADVAAGRELLRAGAQEYVGEGWMSAQSLARAVEEGIERFALLERLRQNEAHMRRLLDNLFAFVGVLLPDGTLIEANRAPLDAAGMASADVIGKKFWDCDWWNFSAESQTRLRAAVESAARGETSRYDVPVRVAGNTRMWIDFQLAPLRDDAGQITHLIPSGMDITARRQAEQALRESEQKLRAIYDGTREYIGLLSPDGTLLEANRASLEFADSRLNEVVGLPFAETVWFKYTPGAPEAVRQAIARAAAGEFVRFEAPIIKPTGETVTFDISLWPVRNEKGEVTLIVPEGRDVTERKAAEERLRASEQALREADAKKDNFIATLAHELRNPLAPIRNAAGVLRQKGPPDPQLAWCRDVIDRQVVQMAHLLDDLLDVSRITRGKLTLRRERLELPTVIERAVEIARPLLDAGKHALTVSLPPQPLALDGDLTRLAQIFSNLLSNAAKYTEPPGRITLSAQAEADEVVVTVRDNGIGIERHHLPRVFEMFSQVESALTRAQGGLGIGLSLVKGLVEMHGGRITARSEGPGKGSEFVVRLPLARAAAADERGEDGAARGVSMTSGCRVLIADDLRDSADSLAILLASQGNEVRVAYDGEQAVHIAEAFQPDIALLDLGMPKVNGYEACRRIRQQPWGGRIVFIAQSGWGQEEDRRRSREAGFDHHVVKPVDPREIDALIRSVVLHRGHCS